MVDFAFKGFSRWEKNENHVPPRRKYSENDANDLLKKDKVDGKGLWGLRS